MLTFRSSFWFSPNLVGALVVIVTTIHPVFASASSFFLQIPSLITFRQASLKKCHPFTSFWFSTESHQYLVVLDAVLDPPVAYTTFGRRAVSSNRFCNNLICLLHCPGIFGRACSHKWYSQFVLLISNLIAAPMLGPAWIIIPTYISHMETLKCKSSMLYKRSSSRRRQST